MLEKERHNLILKLVNERSIVSVGDLLDLLGASEATIRRDINALAERGEVKRIRGGAEAVRPRHQPHLVGMPFAMSQVTVLPLVGLRHTRSVTPSLLKSPVAARS